MKLQIYSDLHQDVNKNKFKLVDQDTFTIIAGDISGYPRSITPDWLYNNVKNGVFVEGNHIVYNRYQHSIQYLLREQTERFPLDANVSLLQDNYKIVDDVVFVGGILWTNYNIVPEGFVDTAMRTCQEYMNDYRIGIWNTLNNDDGLSKERGNLHYLRHKEDLLIGLRPKHTIEMFNKTFSVIKEVAEKFSDKKIVVVTHHAPHTKSVDPVYANHKATPAYVSDLSDFILDHPNIKLWCHGHIHTSSDYMIGDCRIVCNPLGYEQFEKTGFNSHFIVEI